MPEDSLISRIQTDAITDEISKAFDFDFDGSTTFEVPSLTPPDTDYAIGLIVGPSGSGKSTLLKQFGDDEEVVWERSRAICSHFKTSEEAQNRLSGVGFNSIPAWMRPYHQLSTGEQFRADMARRLDDGAVIDEFTSVVDRTVAKSCANAVRRYIRANDLNRVTFASCHYDIMDWLEPDWVFDAGRGQYLTGRWLRPEIKLDVLPCSTAPWSMFRDHHYLSRDLSHFARRWIAVWNDVPVGFASALAFPNGYIKNAWREHRTVILPDYQGLGIGIRLSDCIGEMFIQQGYKYFSKTAHPRMGDYRNASTKWRGTYRNGKPRKDYLTTSTLTKEDKHKRNHANRICYCHEYVGMLKEASC